MAVATLVSDSLVESVKQDVRSLSTCSASTVASLQTLLRSSLKSNSDGSSDRNTKISKARPATIRRKASTTTDPKSTTKSVAVHLQIATEDASSLSTQQKLVLATEVFNIASKTLSDAAQKLSNSKSPLSQTSANQILSPKKTTFLKTSTSNAKGIENKISVIAECARLALSTLRILKSDIATQDGEGYPNLQLEQGVCVLVGRMLVLGLTDLAYEELRALKKRIQLHLDRKASIQNAKAKRVAPSTAPTDDAMKETMADLLGFTNIVYAQPFIGLIVSFQTNVVRLLLAGRKTSILHKTCSKLSLSEPASPANVIVAASEAGALSKEKAALQLVSLSNNILSLSSPNSKPITTGAVSSQLQTKPFITLNLQFLSLEIRTISWRISGHNLDLKRELLDPMTRFLEAYSHSGAVIDRDEFTTVNSCFTRLRKTPGLDQDVSSSSSLTLMPWRLLSTMGRFAYDAGFLDEAMSFYNEAVSLLPSVSDDQPLALGTIRCRVALIHLKRLKTVKADLSEIIAKCLIDASDGLKSFNKGSTQDLEDLFLESARLKKQAMNLLGDIYSSDQPLSRLMAELGSSIVGYLHAFIRFLKRFVGRFATSELEEKNSDESCFESLSKSYKVIFSAIDSAVAVGKASVISQKPAWDDILPIFTDCRRLVNMLTAQPNYSEEARDLTTSLMKISNIFWSKYLKEKESAKTHAELLPLLEQSTLYLQNCSVRDRMTGFAALKYERLAHLLADSNSRSKAVNALRQSIREHIESDCFSDFVTALKGRLPHRACCNVSNPAFSLNRVLSTYLKLQSKRQDENPLFDNETLSFEHRVVMKEWQIGILMEINGPETETEFFRTMLQRCLSNLFEVYTVERFPLRRLRLIGQVIWYHLEHTGMLHDDFAEPLVQEARKSLSMPEIDAEATIMHFAIHVRSYTQLILLFYDGEVRFEDFREILATWSSILDKCHSWDSLQHHIDDPDQWLAHMKSVSDFTEARGWWRLQLTTLKMIIRILEVQETKNEVELSLYLSKYATAYIRIGDCRSASTVLGRAASSIRKSELPSVAAISLTLARTEVFIEVGDFSQAEMMLATARECYTADGEPEEQDKFTLLRLVVNAAFLYSRLYYSQGRLRKALFFAKLSVKLSSKLWAKLERSPARSKRTTDTSNDQSVIDLETEKITALDSRPESVTNKREFSAGATFWPHVQSHHLVLMNAARLSAHNGLFQDTIYYGEQALKVSEAVDAPVRVVASKAQLGREWLRGGRVSEAKRCLTSAVEICKSLDNSVETITCKLGLASVHMARGSYSEVLRLLCDAENSMAGLLNLSTQLTTADLEIEEGMARLSIYNEATSKTRKTVSKRPTRKVDGSANSNHPKNESSETHLTSMESQDIIQLRADILRQQAKTLSMKQNFDEAFRLLSQARQLHTSITSQILLQIAETEYTLADAVRSVASHAVYCVLAESTLSLPSISLLPADEDEPCRTQRPTKTKRPAVKKTKLPKKDVVLVNYNKGTDITELLAKAKLSIDITIKNAVAFGSTMDSHLASRLAGSVSMLLHATTPGDMAQGSMVPAIVNELGRSTAFDREQLAIDLDKELADLPGSLTWPSVPGHFKSVEDCDITVSENFTQTLPGNWNVISISLDSNASEFVISKMRRNSAPFLLRLPLKRGGEEEENDDEEFSFAAGKEEMKQIIQQANSSAHDARSRTDRKSKKDWWALRESLDQRLKALLENVENIWLGGFRSIFSAYPRIEDAFSRFSISFDSVLDKHLPSRRKSKVVKHKRIRLHPDVLELFVGLRNLHDLEDPENPITDLLYFVVDILQFQGERNAYDEIDFDAMVIDTLDILERYHEAANVKAQAMSPQHTILILDKALHLFPWESLPCLEGLPVSRMPSLKTLQDRILKLGIDVDKQNHPSLRVDRSNGSFILNPSGDLRNTQTNFETDLNNMKGWSSIVNRGPSEEEFRSALEHKSLFLYFGHGSGAQYIRGRTIKRLEKCAVTFLMGCSSGCLTEAGEFEPYGTPMNYMHAGSPALVATLWDVTDKDIDRFAQSTFDEWGLVKAREVIETRDDAPKTRGNKGTSKKLDMSTGRDHVTERNDSTSLAEAVCRSRDSCLLRYLNGAAPVIYGLPVMLGP